MTLIWKYVKKQNLNNVKNRKEIIKKRLKDIFLHTIRIKLNENKRVKSKKKHPHDR